MRDDGTVPGQATMKKSGGKKATPPKSVSSIEIDLAENGGITLSVRERYDNDQDRRDGDFPFLEAKKYVFSKWGEASSFLSGVVESRSLTGAKSATATEDEPLTTMGALTDEDLDDAVAGIVSTEAPDNYKSMRVGGAAR